MRNGILATLTAVGLALVSFSPASAGPANGTLGNQVTQGADNTILIADGCGRGRHFSRYRGMCVWNGGGYGYRAYGYPYGYRSYSYYPAYGFHRRGWY